MMYLDKVKITEKYSRYWKTERNTIVEDWKYWRKLPFVSEGVIIGFRTLTNGINRTGDFGETNYTVKESFKVALVVFSQFKNPVYVPLNAIEAIE